MDRAQEVREALLLGYGGDDAVGRAEVGDEDPFEDVAKDLFDHWRAAAWLDEIEAEVLVAEAPQPGGAAADPPARLVGMEVGALLGLLFDIFIDGRKDPGQAMRDLDKGAGGDTDAGCLFEPALDGMVGEPKAEAHRHHEGGWLEAEGGFGQDGDEITDLAPAPRAPVMVDAVLADDTLDADVLGVADLDLAAVIFREGVLAARTRHQGMIAHLVNPLRPWTPGALGGARFPARLLFVLAVIGLEKRGDGGIWDIFVVWPDLLERRYLAPEVLDDGEQHDDDRQQMTFGGGVACRQGLMLGHGGRPSSVCATGGRRRLSQARRRFLAPAASITEVGPVGGLVAGADTAVFFDEGFGENDGMAVTLEPVLAKTFGGKRAEPGGEVSNLCPRQDEEAGVVDEEMEALPTFFRGPAEKAGEAQTRQATGRAPMEAR